MRGCSTHKISTSILGEKDMARRKTPKLVVVCFLFHAGVISCVYETKSFTLSIMNTDKTCYLILLFHWIKKKGKHKNMHYLSYSCQKQIWIKQQELPTFHIISNFSIYLTPVITLKAFVGLSFRTLNVSCFAPNSNISKLGTWRK